MAARGEHAVASSMADAGPRSAESSEHKVPGQTRTSVAVTDPADQSEEGGANALDYGDNIDPPTFEQILEMDEDDGGREFSRGIVYGFFEQAESTFNKMKENLERRDLAQLSSLGHFLKGSSATLGLTKVKDGCEKIQWYGLHKDGDGAHDEPSDDVCLDRIRATLSQVEEDYGEAEKVLREYYDALDG
ncbi:MAG: hypothetical protein M1832_001634 [Thelocarpon impressellum]|nr:MAG: hypothetical protein M1832_001634 [Thelocarpon impressellum]